MSSAQLFGSMVFCNVFDQCLILACASSSVLRLCLFCDYRNCGSSAQANQSFPDFSLTNVKFPKVGNFTLVREKSGKFGLPVLCYRSCDSHKINITQGLFSEDKIE